LVAYCIPSLIRLFSREGSFASTYKLSTGDVLNAIVIPENPPWLNPKPTFIFELTQHKKSETNPLLIQQHFAEIRSVTSEYSTLYTDGSKGGDRVASAAVYCQQARKRI
jgi:hypothetical protein